MVNNLFKENFYEKRKKINVLTIFFIFHKSGIKNFLKWMINHYSKITVKMTLSRKSNVTNTNYFIIFMFINDYLKITKIIWSTVCKNIVK